jgi:hypothetical protein
MTHPQRLLLALLVACTVGDQENSFDRPAATAAVSAVLDALHHNASVANEDAYFALFAPEGVFFGTDITERWGVEEFRAYAHARFAQGQGWTYVLREATRNIEFDPAGQVAWFDEILDNANYGATRGTGAMRLMDGAWKITQYHLTIPIPNELARDVVEQIRGLDSP